MEHADDDEETRHMPGTYSHSEYVPTSPSRNGMNQQSRRDDREIGVVEQQGDAQPEGMWRLQDRKDQRGQSLPSGRRAAVDALQHRVANEYESSPRDAYQPPQLYEAESDWHEYGQDAGENGFSEAHYRGTDDNLHWHEGLPHPAHALRSRHQLDFENDDQHSHPASSNPYRHQHQDPTRPPYRPRRDSTSYERNVQINHPPAAQGPQAQIPSIGETMQTMMMSQMMMQQMQAQQLQQAQMAALSASALNIQAHQPRARHVDEECRRKGKTSVNIQNCQTRGSKKVKRAKVDSVSAVLIQAHTTNQQALPPIPPESSALDNWQEATIILCLIVVGLIYLVSSRASPPDKKKEASLAAKHLT